MFTKGYSASGLDDFEQKQSANLVPKFGRFEFNAWSLHQSCIIHAIFGPRRRYFSCRNDQFLTWLAKLPLWKSLHWVICKEGFYNILYSISPVSIAWSMTMESSQWRETRKFVQEIGSFRYRGWKCNEINLGVVREIKIGIQLQTQS